MFGTIAQLAIQQIELAKFEQKRWGKLTHEQRMEELRHREVHALERIARATENRRYDVHHHFF